VIFGFTVFVGDVIPKFIAVRAPTKVLASAPRACCGRCASCSIRWPCWWSARPTAILRVFVPRHMKSRQLITRDELETLIEMRQEQGTLEAMEAEILTEILEVTELTVRDCMVPRVDLPLIEGSDPTTDIVEALEEATSRFAVIHGATPDTVLGFVDVVQWKLQGRPAWREVMKPPVFVPETFSALDALRTHLKAASDCLLILDEIRRPRGHGHAGGAGRLAALRRRPLAGRGSRGARAGPWPLHGGRHCAAGSFVGGDGPQN